MPHEVTMTAGNAWALMQRNTEKKRPGPPGVLSLGTEPSRAKT